MQDIDELRRIHDDSLLKKLDRRGDARSVEVTPARGEIMDEAIDLLSFIGCLLFALFLAVVL